MLMCYDQDRKLKSGILFFCSLESMGRNRLTRSSKLHVVQEATTREDGRRCKITTRATHLLPQRARELEIMDQQVSEFENLFPLNPYVDDDGLLLPIRFVFRRLLCWGVLDPWQFGFFSFPFSLCSLVGPKLQLSKSWVAPFRNKLCTSSELYPFEINYILVFH